MLEKIQGLEDAACDLELNSFGVTEGEISDILQASDPAALTHVGNPMT